VKFFASNSKPVNISEPKTKSKQSEIAAKQEQINEKKTNTGKAQPSGNETI